jgi:type IV pilus assembly protein PilC
MPVYSYEAVDSKGKKIKAEIEAPTKQDAVNQIHDLGYFPSNIKEKGGGGGGAIPTARKGGGSMFGGGVSAKALTAFTSQLSTLQDAGLPIVRSLKILENQMKPGTLKNTLGVVADDVEGGSTFSEALNKHPRIFNKLYVNMVKAGEAGGVLDTILRRLSEFLEKQEKLKRQIMGAMVYPAVVIFVACGIITGIMIFVVPAFEQIFADIGADLPLPTTILINASQLLQNYWFLIPGIPFLFMVLYRFINSTAGGKYTLDSLKLKAPLFGNIIKKSTISQFTRTLGTLITSGVPILEALGICKNAIGNTVVANAVNAVHESIREGETIAEPLAQSGIFDDLVVNMIDVGEETGELDKMLIKVADNYDNEVEVAVEAMVSLLEPIMIVFMGGAIGFIVVALFLPLIALVEKLG